MPSPPRMKATFKWSTAPPFALTNRPRRQKRGSRSCLGRSRGGLTTKIHAVVNAQRLPIRLSLTAGQSHDGQAADELLDRVGTGTITLADKAYDADRIRASLRERGASPSDTWIGSRRRLRTSRVAGWRLRWVQVRSRGSSRYIIAAPSLQRQFDACA